LTLDDYLVNNLDTHLSESAYLLFWVETVIAALSLLDNESDHELDKLFIEIQHIYQNYKQNEELPIFSMGDKVRSLRGGGFWRDESTLGVKYRCLVAIGTPPDKSDKDNYDWWYGVVTAFQLILGIVSDDAIVIEFIERKLSQFRLESPS